MNYLPVNFKLIHPKAKLPNYAKPGDVGLDLVGVEITYNTDYSFIEYDTGIIAEIPEYHFGLLVPNSRISKYDLTMANSVGIIDSGYRGTLRFRFRLLVPLTLSARVFQVGDTVGQLVILPYVPISPIETETVSETERGNNGFGSTQK